MTLPFEVRSTPSRQRSSAEPVGSPVVCPEVMTVDAFRTFRAPPLTDSLSTAVLHDSIRQPDCRFLLKSVSSERLTGAFHSIHRP